MPPREVEARYRRELTSIVKEVEEDLKLMIIPLFDASNATDSAIVNDIDMSDILSIFTSRMEFIRQKYSDIRDRYKRTAEHFGNHIGSIAKIRFHKMLVRNFAGPDLLEIIAERGVKEAMDMELHENVNLIKSIPDKLIGDVEKLVRNNFLKGSQTPGGLQAEILPLLRKSIRGDIKKAKTRAKFIARDQTTKISASLSKIRHQNIGVKYYIWSNSRDQRVRGNPNGKYPDVPKNKNHWTREGKKYAYNKSDVDRKKGVGYPPDGLHPGEDYLCRCIAYPVIERITESLDD